jgi:GDSL-like Lipase/Acylhydrolase family
MKLAPVHLACKASVWRRLSGAFALVPAWFLVACSGNPDAEDALAPAPSGTVDVDFPPPPNPSAPPISTARGPVLPPPPAVTHTRYPADRTHSPITDAISRRLKAIEAPAQRKLEADRFMKIGDSQTVSTGFLQCFANPGLSVAPYTDLAEPQRAFLQQDRGEFTFRRTSLAAKVGASASFALIPSIPGPKGMSPAITKSPLEAELDVVRAQYAVVMFGSNDIQGAPSSGLSVFAKNMLAITDALLAEGVVPVLSSPPPRPLREADVAAFGAEGADRWVPRFSNVVRGIAEARQVPFVDLERELRRLPGFGIGSDKLHLNADAGGACRLDDSALKKGMNARNLVTFSALARARSGRLLGRPLDEAPDALRGDGTETQPLLVPALPFADFRGGNDAAFRAGSCADASQARQIVYRTSVASETRMYIALNGSKNAKLWLKKSGQETCVLQKQEGEVLLPAGDHQLVVGVADDKTSVLLTLTPAIPAPSP